jgi:membrane protease subunit HflK
MDEQPRQPARQVQSLEGVGEGVKALVRTLQILFFCLRILIIVIFVWLLFSGVFYVDEQEEAMLFRFGRLQTKVLDRERGPTAVLTSGQWYWAWPYPIDWVKKIPAQKSITVSTRDIFWPQINPNAIQTPETATAPNVLVPGQDGYLLTGDTNIMHTVWSLTYRVTDAKRYYLAFYDDGGQRPAASSQENAARKRGAEAVIQNVLANSVLAEMATWAVEDVLTTTRETDPDSQIFENLKELVRQRVERRLDAIDLGIQIQQVNLIELQPPLATLDAFRQVVDAAQTRREQIDLARAYAEDVVPKAEGEAYRIIDEAKAYKTRIVASVEAESAYFKAVLEEYEKNPKTMLVALYADAIRDILGRTETKYIIHARQDGQQEIRLMIGPEPEKPTSGNAANTNAD